VANDHHMGNKRITNLWAGCMYPLKSFKSVVGGWKKDFFLLAILRSVDIVLLISIS
jgi:hypothetical protein